MSDNASTSVSDSLSDSGDVAAVRGLDCESMRGVVLWDVAGCWVALGTLNLLGVLAAFKAFVRSASRFSSVPRSVFPLSSSDKSPDNRKSDSIRPKRFSRPSIYLALQAHLAQRELGRHKKWYFFSSANIPFRRIPFFLDLRKDAVRLVVDAMRALGHFAVAFDFLFPTHIACLSTS